MKIFAVSDIHGHYCALREALSRAGFIENDPGHLLICCGDCFDRGHENIKVLEYFTSLENKILIRGNHEDILEKILEHRMVDDTDIHNGTDITLREFFGEESIDHHGRLDISQCAETVAKIKKFIGSMYDYFETENHIFTHAWLPIYEDGEKRVLCPDYQHTPHMIWKKSRYIKWYEAYSEGLIPENKTVVCGHRAAYHASEIDSSRDEDDCSLYTADGLAVLDGSTVRTKNVNVYICEDSIREPRTYQMTLMRKYFDRLVSGKKTVEMRLLDEKRSELALSDIIEFSCVDNLSETVRTKIIGLYKYSNFSRLSSDFSPSELGYTMASAEDIPYDMEIIYGKEKIEKYGALAIRVTSLL